jgi:hypothetical protein
MTKSLFAIALVCIWNLVAVAQPSRKHAAPSAECAAAEKHRAQADQLIAEGVFDKALETYQLAFDTCHTPKFRAAMIFNIGLAHKKRAEQPIDEPRPRESLELRRRAVEDRRRALARFRDFLSWMPSGKLADEARAYVFRLEGDIDKQEVLVATETRRIAEEEERQRRMEEARHRMEGAHRRAALRHRRLRVAGIAVAGLGVAVSAVGGYYGWRASSLSNELSRVEDWTPQADAKVAAGERAETRMIVFTAIGGAAVISAGVLYWYGRSARPGRVEQGLTTVSVSSESIAAAWHF